MINNSNIFYNLHRQHQDMFVSCERSFVSIFLYNKETISRTEFELL